MKKPTLYLIAAAWPPRRGSVVPAIARPSPRTSIRSSGPPRHIWWRHRLSTPRRRGQPCATAPAGAGWSAHRGCRRTIITRTCQSLSSRYLVRYSLKLVADPQAGEGLNHVSSVVAHSAHRCAAAGATIVFIAVGLGGDNFVMAGLALDMGHTMLNKSRLQNAADAGGSRCGEDLR